MDQLCYNYTVTRKVCRWLMTNFIHCSQLVKLFLQGSVSDEATKFRQVFLKNLVASSSERQLIPTLHIYARVIINRILNIWKKKIVQEENDQLPWKKKGHCSLCHHTKNSTSFWNQSNIPASLAMTIFWPNLNKLPKKFNTHKYSILKSSCIYFFKLWFYI